MSTRPARPCGRLLRVIAGPLLWPVLLFPAMATPTTVPAAPPDRLPLVIAHRGASGHLPEHTLAAKALAVGLGAGAIEQDVVLSRDGVPIVFHDPYLDATTDVAARFPGRARADGRHYVMDFDLAELRTLATARAGGPGERPAALRESLCRHGRVLRHRHPGRGTRVCAQPRAHARSHGRGLSGDQAPGRAPCGRPRRDARGARRARAPRLPDAARPRLPAVLRRRRAAAHPPGAAFGTHADPVDRRPA